jgi:aryl-alcohol dehydrogenase-like predicted oxidoreductase
MMSYGKHETRPWTLDEDAAEPILRRAAEGGINFYDTADVYNGGESEVLTGRLLSKLFGMREEYVVATKVNGRTMPGENGTLYTSADFDVVESADQVASERGVPTAQVALAWLLYQPGVTAPIVGATKLEHLEDALAAEQLLLSDGEIERLQERYVPHAVVGHQ